MIKAALGGKVEVPLIEGGKITIDVPAGSQYSDRLRLKDKGMSKVRSQTRGDMFVHVHIIVPQNLTKKQIHALELASKEFNDDENHISAFDKIKNLWS
jgi:molecular chaperone DnaJ